MQSQSFDYYDGETLLKGYLSFPQTSHLAPLVLVFPDWTGRNPFADSQADALAKLGYIGLAVDMYGNGQLGQTNEEKMQLMQPLMQDRAYLQQRILATLAAAQSVKNVNKEKIAAIGFCFGGLCALDLARSGANIKGAVSFHGLLNAPEKKNVDNIQAKILVLHGYNDPMVPPEQLNHFATEMTNAKVDWQIHAYGNTLHAFTNPNANDPELGTVFNQTANDRSMLAMKTFLAEILN